MTKTKAEVFTSAFVSIKLPIKSISSLDSSKMSS